MLSTLLLWFLVASIFIAPVVLRFFAEDHPRSDDPPDTGEDDRAVLPLAA